MPKHGKVQMMLSDFGTFGTSWNAYRTNQEQKKTSKVPLSKIAKKIEQWNKVLYGINIQIVMLFQKCSKPVPMFHNFASFFSLFQMFHFFDKTLKVALLKGLGNGQYNF